MQAAAQKGLRMSDCIFCKIAAGDIPSSKIYEDDDVIAFKDTLFLSPKRSLPMSRF